MKRAVALALLFVAHAASAQQKGPCDAAYESGQELRNAGKLVSARAKFIECSHPMCPSFEQSDCSKWLDEIRATIPTVAVDAAGAHATVDGAEATASMELDPGDHVLACERPSAARTTVRFTLAPKERDKAVACPLPEVLVRTTPVTSTSRVPAIVVGASGLALLAGGLTLDAVTYFGDVAGFDKCTPNCARSDVDAARTKLIVGDVIAGVGIVVIGVATYLFFHKTAPPQTATRGLVLTF
jgi:hypothetical protein